MLGQHKNIVMQLQQVCSLSKITEEIVVSLPIYSLHTKISIQYFQFQKFDFETDWLIQ